MYMHCLHSLFYQLSNYNLFAQHVIYLYGETPLVNYGSPGPFFYIHITIYFLQALCTFLQTNFYYHTVRLILCLQQTDEIDNFTVIWGKVLWLCYVQVTCCCWCQSYAPDRRHIQFSGAVAKASKHQPSEVVSFSYWVD
jgi:hypothetical protein